jgi:[acyl-carrier-protein] S-malonyltransferase
MGQEWLDEPEWQVVTHAEEVLQRPLARLLLDASDDELAHTDAGQLSVLLVSLMAHRSIADTLGRADVVGVAGHSLGQVTALLATGVVDHDAGLRLAAARADASADSAIRAPGRMAALIGASLDQAHAACAEDDPAEVWVANDNAPGQVVLAGRPAALDRALARARELGVRRSQVLSVGHAFHTPLLVDAAAAWQPALAATHFRAPSHPLVTNTDAQVHRGSDGWPETLTRHLIEPVRWRASQHALVSLGATELVEVGPGSILGALARRTVPDVPCHQVGTPAQAEAFVAGFDARPTPRQPVAGGAPR